MRGVGFYVSLLVAFLVADHLPTVLAAATVVLGLQLGCVCLGSDA